MNNPKETLAREIRIFLETFGIDPGYAATLFILFVAISYRKDIKNWEKLEGWRKSIIGSTIIAAIVVSIISLFRITGVI